MKKKHELCNMLDAHCGVPTEKIKQKGVTALLNPGIMALDRIACTEHCEQTVGS